MVVASPVHGIEQNEDDVNSREGTAGHDHEYV
jgi:hypothetical protein